MIRSAGCERYWAETRQAVEVRRNTEGISCNHCCSGESNKCYMFWVCVCSLGIQHAMRMRRIILSSVVCPSLPFSASCHKLYDFIKKKKLLNTECVFWFSLQLLSEIFLVLRRIKRDMTKNSRMSNVMYRLLTSDFNEIWIFWTDFLKNTKFHENMSIGSRIVPCGRTYWRTDMTKTRVAFRGFAKSS